MQTLHKLAAQAVNLYNALASAMPPPGRLRVVQNLNQTKASAERPRQERLKARCKHFLSPRFNYALQVNSI